MQRWCVIAACALAIGGAGCQGARLVPSRARAVAQAVQRVQVPPLRPGPARRLYRARGTPGLRGGWERFVGGGAGVSVPGDQDLKLKKHDAFGMLTNYLFSDDVDATSSVLTTVFAGAWSRHPRWERFGWQVDLSYWQTTIEPENYVDRSPPGTAYEPPPQATFRQHRVSIYASGLWRFAFPNADFDPQRRFLYVGAGLGPVWTQVERGHVGWNWAFQFLGGAALPLGRRTRLRLELRYMVAPDADAPARAAWRIDTSGTGMFPGFAHKDTRFFAALLAIEHRF